MNKKFNITFEIKIPTEDKSVLKPVTFYSVDAVYPDPHFGNAVLVSGGKEWHATSTYEEIWEKIKRHVDESAT